MRLQRLQPARLAGVLVAGGLALSGAGCLIHEQLLAPQESVYVKGQTPTPVKNEPLTRKDENGNVKPPKASTYVAHGDYLKSCGDQANQRAANADSDQHRRLLKNQATNLFAQARQRYETALQTDPKEITAHLGLARVAAAEGNVAEAQRQYQSLLKTYGNSALLWHEMGMLNARQKNFEQAITQLARAYELEPRNPTISSSYGWTLARAERFEEAWNVFRGQVGEAQAYYRLAQMARHLDKTDLAKAYLTYALQRDPALSQAQEMLATLDTKSVTPIPDPSAVQPAVVQEPQP